MTTQLEQFGVISHKSKNIEAKLGPVSPVHGSNVNTWSGDNMFLGHAVVRDRGLDHKKSLGKTKAKTVIVGGGISGLATAYLLRDEKPLLIDLNSNLGGNSRGEFGNGIKYPIGAAYLTLYRALPFAGCRGQLFPEESYGAFRSEFEKGFERIFVLSQLCALCLMSSMK